MESTISPVEAEYIKNLQLQIYFLELEASFLREQTKKATNLQPRLSEEADHILHKLQDFHSQCNGLKLEVKRRDASLLILRRDQDNLRGQVQSAEVTQSKDKQQMVEDVVRLKKLKELTDLQTSQREMEILKIKQELDRELTNLASNEQRVRSIQSQIKQRSEQKQTVENQLSEKRVDLLKVNSAKRDMEEKLLKRTAITQNQITVDLRNELSFLHQQIRDRDMQSEQDRVLRSKMMADCELLANEKNTLSNQLMELNKQLEMQRGLKEENYSYDSSSIAQLLSVKDREEQLSSEITRHKELLHLENIHFKDMTEQVNLFQNGKKLQDLHMATSSSRITELQAVLAKETQINSELRRDKSLLVDHVTNLQAQIINKDAELGHILSRIEALETRMSTVRTDHELQKTLQAGRWQEISDMADSMKKLTRPLDIPLASFERL